jgi:hypothetical protein
MFGGLSAASAMGQEKQRAIESKRPFRFMPLLWITDQKLSITAVQG